MSESPQPADDDGVGSNHEHQADREQPGSSAAGPDARNADGDRSQSGALTRHAEAEVWRPSDDGLEVRRSSVGDLYGEDQPLSGLTLSQSYRGPLPLASEYQAYELAHPGSADRILGMAERSLDANIKRDLIPVQAEARAFTFATVTTSLLPYIALVLGFVLVLNGHDGIGFITVAVGLLSTGPHIIAATRRALASDPKQLEDEQPPDQIAPSN